MPPKHAFPGGRRAFSIATFFDAASPSARRAAGGFRIGSGGGHRLSGELASSSGGSGLSPSRGGPLHSRTNNSDSHGNEDAAEGGIDTTGPTNEYSATLHSVRDRILAEVAAEAQATTGGSGCRDDAPHSPSRLQQHRQRALQIAFGSRGSSSKCSGGGTLSQRKSGTYPINSNNNGDDDDDLVVSSTEFSLLCPYSRLPMAHPVRSRDCRHMQCCNLESWMVLLDKTRSMRDPKGPCPVCEQRIAASSLEVDFWMMSVSAQMPAGTRLVELDADGTYRNGDLTRARRRDTIPTEVVVDATQDYESYLGEAIDDDGDDDDINTCDVASDGGNGATRLATVGQSAASPATVVAPQKRPRSPTPPRPLPPRSVAIPEVSPTVAVGGVGSDGTSRPPLVSVKQERFQQQQEESLTLSAATAASTAAELSLGNDHHHHHHQGSEDASASLPTTTTTSFSSVSLAPPQVSRTLPMANDNEEEEEAEEGRREGGGEGDAHTFRGGGGRAESAFAPSQDPAAVIVFYVEGKASRALPSQIRLWAPHCPQCGAPHLKGEDGAVSESCRGCGRTARAEWTLLRRFEESAAVSMELTADDTLILKGVDAAAAYLLRAGFQRTQGCPTGGGGGWGAVAAGRAVPTRHSPPAAAAAAAAAAGLWTTSAPLTRVELDFLEACCLRAARGEDVEELSAMGAVPSLFRIPRRRGAGGNTNWGSGTGGGYGSYSSTQQQQQRGGGDHGYSQGGSSRNLSRAASGNSQQQQQQQQPTSSSSQFYPLFAGARS